MFIRLFYFFLKKIKSSWNCLGWSTWIGLTSYYTGIGARVGMTWHHPVEYEIFFWRFPKGLVWMIHGPSYFKMCFLYFFPSLWDLWLFWDWLLGTPGDPWARPDAKHPKLPIRGAIKAQSFRPNTWLGPEWAHRIPLVADRNWTQSAVRIDQTPNMGSSKWRA